MKLLIVDDQKDIVESLRDDINWKGIGIDKIYTACSASEAKLQLLDQEIDILLTDIEMPEENGIELFRWVRARDMDLLGIFLTAHPDFKYTKEAIRLGGFDYILQPARYEEIQKVVQEAVWKRNEKLESKMPQEKERRKSQAEMEKELSFQLDEGTEADKQNYERQIHSLEKYLKENLSRNISRTEASKMLHLNEDYFSRLFKKYTGTTYKDYIMELRIGQAKHLLAKSCLSVSIIAGKVGYDNFSYFSTIFRKMTGMSPQEYRQQEKQSS